MQKYANNYLKSLGLDVGDIDQIVCEVSGNKAAEIHHITPRSLQGSDEPENLIALDRDEHDKAACGKLTKHFLYWIVKKRMGDKFRPGMETKK